MEKGSSSCMSTNTLSFIASYSQDNGAITWSQTRVAHFVLVMCTAWWQKVTYAPCIKRPESYRLGAYFLNFVGWRSKTFVACSDLLMQRTFDTRTEPPSLMVPSVYAESAWHTVRAHEKNMKQIPSSPSARCSLDQAPMFWNKSCFGGCVRSCRYQSCDWWSWLGSDCGTTTTTEFLSGGCLVLPGDAWLC